MDISDTLQTVGVAGVVAAIVNSGFRIWGDRLFLNFRLKQEHKQKQRERLQDLIGEYHGRMLEAAIDWDRRMSQFYDEKFDFSALRFEGEDLRDHEQYLFHSVVFRFCSLLAIARRFETHAFYIDSRIGRRHLEFLRYAKSFIWVMTVPDLTPDDGQPGHDHFRNDAFRPLLDLCYLPLEGVPTYAPSTGQDGGTKDPIFDWRRYWALLFATADANAQHHSEMQELLHFFHGLHPNEMNLEKDGDPYRRRWERLACLHLLVLGFVATFGYDWQRDRAEDKVHIVVDRLLGRDAVAAVAFLHGVPELGLRRQKQMRRTVEILERRCQDAKGVRGAAVPGQPVQA